MQRVSILWLPVVKLRLTVMGSPISLTYSNVMSPCSLTENWIVFHNFSYAQVLHNVQLELWSAHKYSYISIQWASALGELFPQGSRARDATLSFKGSMFKVPYEVKWASPRVWVFVMVNLDAEKKNLAYKKRVSHREEFSHQIFIVVIRNPSILTSPLILPPSVYGWVMEPGWTHWHL